MAKGDTTSTTKTELPSEARQYLAPWLKTANQLYSSSAPQYFPGQTVAGFTPEQETAQAAQVARGTFGSPTVGAANTYAQDAIGGKYLNSNPWVGDAARLAATGADSAASQAGRYGSGAHADTRLQAIAPVLAGAYQQERGLQQGMAQFAPTLAQEDYRDIAAIGDVGQQRQAMGQEFINADIARHDYNQARPFNNVNQMLGLIYGMPGGQTSVTQPGPSAANSGIGALLSAMGLAYGLR